ncbi:GNAT family N-acetyltransferase [Gordonia sp. zg691]|uniref:GNAT family N-acetyltransferase n=1 Tax=Gordonia jinghuaiqii TaxID=2758710 RepID=A0A7D7R3X0_9ACTN|nr:GNAT family N-acetyltransferase [Gordonia jinghuaiqii]MBD0863978.1 GNAT family N-acetyltransferase [Gordonia jinghuaiqii]MCR5977909.1 GNAT family N-acetyltransferase [Gordonia jinghuaiqii]QMT02567.1 GNAT family N-acetyltransferase [Gordonia jinghuaiqii]
MSQSPPGVEVRELSSPDELEELMRIFDDVWRPDPTNRPVGTDMLRALVHTGNYVAGAYIGDDLAGGSVGFFATPVGEALHSHITGVTRRGRGHQVGYTLKMHQREWALSRGLSTITWTFDPLVARNAHFNITKLGATPVHYYEDFYGEIGDELGGDADSDRVLMSWDLGSGDSGSGVGGSGSGSAGSGSVGSGSAGSDSVDELLAEGAVSVIDVDDPSRPVAHHERVTPETAVVVAVPRDIEAMRVNAPLEAARWRIELRDALSPLLVEGDGRRAVRFLRTGHYVFGPAGSGVR